MTTYSLDVGLNRDLLPSPRLEHGAAILAQGFTEIGVVGNPIFTARTFERGDRLKITVYDLSPKVAGVHLPIEEMSLYFTFSEAIRDEAESPVDGGEDSFECFSIFPGPNLQKSTVFESRFPVWFCELGKKRYPKSQLQDETKLFGEDVFLLENKGHFYYSMEIQARWQGETSSKRFRIDPEMIIDFGEGEEQCEGSGD